MDASPCTISRLPRELLDRIFDILWFDTSLLIYASDHVVKVSYETSSNPSSQIPRWLVTSKFFLAAGLAQFQRHGVVTCIRPAAHLPSPVHAHIGRDTLLLHSVSEMRLDVAVRCSEKQVVSNSHCHAWCSLLPREEYWDTLVPLGTTGPLVRSFLPGLEQLTLQIDLQLLEWMGDPKSFSIASKPFRMLGARWRHVTIEVARPDLDCDDTSALHVGSLDALFRRMQIALAELGTLFTHLYTAEHRHFGASIENALDRVYQDSACWLVYDGVRLPNEPTAMTERVEEYLHWRKRISKSERMFNDWIDARTGTWHLEITYPKAKSASQRRVAPPSLKYTGLCSLLAPNIHPTAPFFRDDSPRTGVVSYSCVEDPALGFYIDDDESGAINAHNERQVHHRPVEPIYEPAHRYTRNKNFIKAPEREGGDFVPGWERVGWVCSSY